MPAPQRGTPVDLTPAQASDGLDQTLGRFGEFGGRFAPETLIVITSYSIHYTKLYEHKKLATQKIHF